MSPEVRPGGIGYVLKKFPVLSETFILNEILALEARGVPIHIFSLERPNDPRFHNDLPKLKAAVSYVPDLLDAENLWKHNQRAIRVFGRRYFRALGYALVRGAPALVWRVLQASYVANEARRLKLTHLHAHFATRPTSVAFLASRLTGIPYSFTAHAMDIYKRQLRADALARKIDHARLVVTVSDYNKQFLTERVGAAQNKVQRVYNGIDLQRFAPNGGPPGGKFTMISVARFVEKKGHRVLVEACRLLYERGLSFECWLIGKGKLRSDIQAQIKSLNLGGYVSLLGAHTQLEVLERYQHAHLCVLPCLIATDGNREGLPVSIVEALACGLPVVSTPLTGIPEVVRDGYNGLLVAPGDAEALANALERIMREPALFMRLRANARPSVLEQFDLKQTAAILEQLFLGSTDENLLSVR
jgi:glycosyltransferase involved in cell wall biosynthesis